MTPREFLDQLSIEAERSMFHQRLKMWVDPKSEVAKFVVAYEEHFNAHLAGVWDEAAEATAEWMYAYAQGNNGPPDPPRNPYDRTTQ